MTLARVETPLELAQGEVLDADVVVVPVLRAGLGMVEAVLDLLPHARVGHIGLQRDEHTARRLALLRSACLPTSSNSTALVVDPMLATGGSALAAIALLQQAGAQGHPPASASSPRRKASRPSRPRTRRCRFSRRSIDRELNAQKFILPGLGDFGDRLYGTA